VTKIKAAVNIILLVERLLAVNYSPPRFDENLAEAIACPQ
jgi:hypothetical protein